MCILLAAVFLYIHALILQQCRTILDARLAWERISRFPFLTVISYFLGGSSPKTFWGIVALALLFLAVSRYALAMHLGLSGHAIIRFISGVSLLCRGLQNPRNSSRQSCAVGHPVSRCFRQVPAPLLRLLT